MYVRLRRSVMRPFQSYHFFNDMTQDEEEDGDYGVGGVCEVKEKRQPFSV